MSDVGEWVVEVLQRRRVHARFVAEIARQLGLDSEAVVSAIAELEAEGRVLMREQYCADPHLEGVDLRVVALIDADGEGDGVGLAGRSIDEVWERWLGEYLANHRCT